MLTVKSDLTPQELKALIELVSSKELSLPSRFSPSSLSSYRSCPKAFWFSRMCRVSSPPSFATMVGTITHTATEKVFDLDPQDRTVESAMGFASLALDELVAVKDVESVEDIDPGWLESQSSQYQHILNQNPNLLDRVELMVSNWFELERVQNFTPKDLLMPDGSTIDGREMAIEAVVDGVKLLGYVDRFDTWKGSSGTLSAVTDYKTGKVPADRFVDKYMIQLKIYALMLQETYGVAPSRLRLLFLSSSNRSTAIKNMFVSDKTVESAKEYVLSTVDQVKESHASDTWETKTGPLCDYCFFKSVCPAFNS